MASDFPLLDDVDLRAKREGHLHGVPLGKSSQSLPEHEHLRALS